MIKLTRDFQDKAGEIVVLWRNVRAGEGLTNLTTVVMEQKTDGQERVRKCKKNAIQL